MGEMLQDGGNPWRGMVYGMTGRLPWAGDPRPLWKAWDEFGIADSRMIGFWVPVESREDRPPRRARHGYVRDGQDDGGLASWAKEHVDVRLAIDWKALGLDPATGAITAPGDREVPGGDGRSNLPRPIPVEPGKGWLLVVAVAAAAVERACPRRGVCLRPAAGAGPTRIAATDWSAQMLITLAVLVVVVLAVVVIYNGLVRLSVLVDNAWADIDVQLKRRHDLIPNLVETVKGYAAHEKGTLEAVVDARSNAMSAQSPAASGEAEGA